MCVGAWVLGTGYSIIALLSRLSNSGGTYNIWLTQNQWVTMEEVFISMMSHLKISFLMER